MNIFYLVRHAHADWSLDENRPLSVRGQRDAERVAEVLDAFPITAIYSSPARRARQTIAPLASRLSLPIQTEPDLHERLLCAGYVDDFFTAVKATWADLSFAFPGGESNTTAQRRGMVLLNRLLAQHPAEHIVLSTHGNLLALLLQHFDPAVDYEFWRSLTMPDIYELRIGGDSEIAMRRLYR